MHVLLEHTPFKFNCSRTQWVPAILQAGSLEHTMHAQASRLHRAGFELALVQCQPKLTPVELSTVVHREQAAGLTTTYLPKAAECLPRGTHQVAICWTLVPYIFKRPPSHSHLGDGVCTLICEIAYLILLFFFLHVCVLVCVLGC